MGQARWRRAWKALRVSGCWIWPAGMSVLAAVRACGAGQVIDQQGDQLPMFPGGLGAEYSIRSTAWP
jgi:hypothetical protein